MKNRQPARRWLAFFLLTASGVLLGAELGQPPFAQALTSGDYFLRRSGGEVLSIGSPTAGTAQFKDSPAVNRTTYQEVGVWAATPTDLNQRLTTTTALHV